MKKDEDKAVSLIRRNPNGCPCGGDCCDNPDVGGFEHEECDGDDFCEACHGCECFNCGASCFCDV